MPWTHGQCRGHWFAIELPSTIHGDSQVDLRADLDNKREWQQQHQENMFRKFEALQL